MTKIELGPPKTCPFCGSPAELKEKREDYGYTPAAVAYGCTRCNYQLPFVDYSGMPQDSGHKTKAAALLEAITKWNTRNGEVDKVEVQ